MRVGIAVALLLASVATTQAEDDDARKALEKSCTGGAAPECIQLSEMYDAGTGVGRDVEKATDYVEKACELGLASACFELGHRRRRGVGTKVDLEKATEL